MRRLISAPRLGTGLAAAAFGTFATKSANKRLMHPATNNRPSHKRAGRHRSHWRHEHRPANETGVSKIDERKTSLRCDFDQAVMGMIERRLAQGQQLDEDPSRTVVAIQ